MRIGVIARRLAGQPFGIARYIEQMVRYWERMIQPSDHVTLYGWEPLARDDLRFSGAIDIKVIRPQLIGALWENVLLPRHAN